MENVQITAVAKEFKNGTQGYEVKVDGLDGQLNCSMNFTDSLKAMRYMFVLAKRLELQIDHISLTALSLAYKRAKEAMQKAVDDATKVADEVNEQEAEKAPEPEKVEAPAPEQSLVSQFKALKVKHPDALLLFRCGDFYESYFEDAKACAEVLGITLTRSSKDGTEMAGFPHHALDTYLPKLIRAGKRVAICDPMEQPKPKRTRKVSANKQAEMDFKDESAA